MPADRIATALRDLAATLPEGARLPSVRELMREHGASPVTVQRAIASLAAEGVVVPRPGRGTFVAAPPATQRRLRPRAGRRSRSARPRVDDGGAVRAARRPARGHARAQLRLPRPAPAADRGARDGARPRRPPAGRLGEGRRRGRRRAARLVRERGGRPLRRARRRRSAPAARPRCVTAVRALAPPGGAVLVESPTYRGALAAVRAAGLTPVPVPSDADGVRPALLADALERTGARVAYLQPMHANPHGADLTAERRAQVMEIAAARRRVPDRGRLGAATSPSTARRRRPWPPTTPTATSSTCAR